MSRHRLGSLDGTALDDALHGILSALGDPRISSSYWETYVTGSDTRQRAYGLLNALGTDYGAQVATDMILAMGAGQVPAMEAMTPADLEAAAAKLHEISAAADAKATLQPPDTALFEEVLAETRMPKAAREAASFKSKTHDPMMLWDYAVGREDQIYVHDFFYSVGTYMAVAAGMLEDAAIWMKTGYPVRWGPGEISYVPETLVEMQGEQLNKELARVLKAGNQQVARLISYGQRAETLPANLIFTKLAWSNGGKRWQVIYGENDRLVRAAARRGQKSTTLDANELLLPFHPWLVDKIAEELDPLPIYAQSLEAKERDENIKPTDAGMREVIRRLVAQGNPDFDREEISVETVEVWEVAKKAKAQYRKDKSQINFSMQALAYIFEIAGKNGQIMPYYRVFEEWLERR
jgi:hypothetical protein